MSMATAIATLASPVGTIEVEAANGWLIAVRIIGDGGAPAPAAGPTIAQPGDRSLLDRAIDQLNGYFAGRIRSFDLPLTPAKSPRGAVLRAAIAAIPYGETQSYGGLARLHDSSSRAVGQACRRNPFPIIIPCHRVISTSGPEHYSGGNGPLTKGWLNRFEREGIAYP